MELEQILKSATKLSVLKPIPKMNRDECERSQPLGVSHGFVLHKGVRGQGSDGKGVAVAGHLNKLVIPQDHKVFSEQPIPSIYSIIQRVSNGSGS